MGNIYIAGNATSVNPKRFFTTFDSSSLILGLGGAGGYILQVTTNGSILYGAQASSAGFTSMVCDSYGFVYAAMYSSSAITFYDYFQNQTISQNVLATPVGGQDIYIVKMQPNTGYGVWGTRMGSTGSDLGYIAIDSTNTMLVVGGTNAANISFYDTSSYSYRVYNRQLLLNATSTTNSFLTLLPLV